MQRSQISTKSYNLRIYDAFIEHQFNSVCTCASFCVRGNASDMSNVIRLDVTIKLDLRSIGNIDSITWNELESIRICTKLWISKVETLPGVMWMSPFELPIVSSETIISFLIVFFPVSVLTNDHTIYIEYSGDLQKKLNNRIKCRLNRI